MEAVTPEGSPVALEELSPHHRVDEVSFTQGVPIFRASRAEWQEQGGLIVRDEAVQVSRRQAPKGLLSSYRHSKEFRFYPAGEGELSSQIVFPGSLSTMTYMSEQSLVKCKHRQMYEFGFYFLVKEIFFLNFKMPSP